MYQSKKPYTKPAAAPVAAAPVTAAPAANGSANRPTHTVKVKTSKEGELQTVTGLFAGESPKGIKYLSITLKNDLHFPAGSTIMIFENTPKE